MSNIIATFQVRGLYIKSSPLSQNLAQMLAVWIWSPVTESLQIFCLHSRAPADQRWINIHTAFKTLQCIACITYFVYFNNKRQNIWLVYFNYRMQNIWLSYLHIVYNYIYSYVPRQKYSEYIGWLSLSYLSYIATANIQKEQQKWSEVPGKVCTKMTSKKNMYSVKDLSNRKHNRNI